MFCGKANGKPERECHPRQNHCTGEYVCTKVGLKSITQNGRNRNSRREKGLNRKRFQRFRRPRFRQKRQVRLQPSRLRSMKNGQQNR